MSSYSAKTSGATMIVGHSFTVAGGRDTYANSRAYSSFDLSGYADADITIYGESSPSDGTLTRTEAVPSGDPPTEEEGGGGGE